MGRERTLREFELFVLMAVAHLDGEGYGVTIRREIERRSGRSVSVGALYTTLARLESRGLVQSRASDPLPVPGGRARKHIKLTAEGRRALSVSTRSLLGMLDGLEPMLGGES